MKKLILGKKKDDETLVIDPDRMVPVERVDAVVDGLRNIMLTRASGSFDRKALYLDRVLEWVLGQDDEGITCLVPLRRV